MWITQALQIAGEALRKPGRPGLQPRIRPVNAIANLWRIRMLGALSVQGTVIRRGLLGRVDGLSSEATPFFGFPPVRHRSYQEKSASAATMHDGRRL
jgi:hypothetical protein